MMSLREPQKENAADGEVPRIGRIVGSRFVPRKYE
jgi:hypothetical protein